MEYKSEQVAKLTWQIDARADRDTIDRAMNTVAKNGGEFLIVGNDYLDAKRAVSAKKGFERAVLRGSPEMAGLALAEQLLASHRAHDPAALRAVPIPAKLANDEQSSKKLLGAFERQLNSYYGEDDSLKERSRREAQNHSATLELKQTIERARGPRHSMSR
jgi:hypothetical protein